MRFIGQIPHLNNKLLVFSQLEKWVYHEVHINQNEMGPLAETKTAKVLQDFVKCCKQCVKVFLLLRLETISLINKHSNLCFLLKNWP